MTVTSMEFSYSEYRTTCPPVSYTESRRLFRDFSGCTLEVNKNGSTYRYRVTQEAFDETARLLESLEIPAEIFAKLQAASPPPEMPPMAGGSVSRRFSFTANGVSVSVNEASPAVSHVAAALQQLAGESDLVFADEKPAPVVPGIQMPVPAPAPAPAGEGTWQCGNCGAWGDRKFCRNCGSPRPAAQK